MHTGRDWRIPIPGGMVALRRVQGRLTCWRGDYAMNFAGPRKVDLSEG